MPARTDSLDKSAAPLPQALAFAGRLAGNICLSLGAMLVRLVDTGPVAAAFWRLLLALPVIALLGWREAGGRLPSRHALLVAAGAGALFALDLAAWHLGIIRDRKSTRLNSSH